MSTTFDTSAGALTVGVNSARAMFAFEHNKTGVRYVLTMDWKELEVHHDVFRDKVRGMSILGSAPYHARIVMDVNQEFAMLTYRDKLSNGIERTFQIGLPVQHPSPEEVAAVVCEARIKASCG